MPRRRRTATTTSSRVARGLGQGEFDNYVPYLHRRNVPSNGRSTHMPAFARKRHHCVLSMLERRTLMMLAWDDLVIDINEQFPLLPVERTEAIAGAMGILHPRQDGHLRERTLDFRVRHRELGLVGLSVKPAALLDKRQKDLAKLEREFVHQEGGRWAQVTEKDIPLVRATNLDFLNKRYGLRLEGLLPKQHSYIANRVMDLVCKGQNLAQACLKVTRACGLEPGQALAISWNWLARKRWSVDLNVALVPWAMHPTPLPPKDTAWVSRLALE